MLRQLGSLLLLIFLTACGGDHSNGSYTIAFDSAWTGMDLMGQQNNLSGFSRDLLREIGKKEKVKLSMSPVSWDVLVPNLKSKQYHGILSSIYPYLFNKTFYEFSDAYLLTGPVLVLPSDSPFKSIAQLDGKEIAVLPDSDGTLYLEKNPYILIRNYDSIPDALNDIIAGVIDGAVVDVLLASAYCKNIYNGKLKIATAPLNDEGIRLLTLDQGSPDLIKIFNRGVSELKKTGTYEALLNKWSLGQVTP
jgi:polar amino acid transport system substrate-binding protein